VTAEPAASRVAVPPRMRTSQRVSVPRRAGSATLSPAPTPAAASGGGIVDRVRAYLTGLEGERAGSLNDSLSRATYLITDRAGSPASRAAASPTRKIAVAIALAVLAVAGLAMTLRTPATPAGGPGHLWVESLDGRARTLNGKPLEERTPIEPGDGVGTGPRTIVTLVTPGGDKVVVNADSSFAFAGLEATGSAGGNRYNFNNVTGEVSFDFRKGGDLELRAGPRRIRAGRASLLVARDRRAPSLTMVAGTGYLTHDKGGETIVLRAGDTIGLD
jgi:hypothetical protein